jgi:GrpB-like predicted nucleotidyltransferase (UPF0157 family)/predicted enzyme related to lactoylglutathione lyase
VTDRTRELRLVVTAADYDDAVHFYRDVLGLHERASFTDDNGGRAVLLHAGRGTLELGDESHAEAIDALEAGHRVAGSVRLAFEVADADAVAARLVAAGATAIAAPVRTPWGSLNARVAGPGGQQVTLWSSPPVYLGDRPRLDGQVRLAEPDPGWGAAGGSLVAALRSTLGPAAIVAAHVGSTSVPGLAAKAILDLVLGVADPTDEDSYVPALETLGYDLYLREPEWHQHRLLRQSDPAVNLHVFAAGSQEIDRMLAFRDHLRRDGADRALYLRTKGELAARTWAFTQDYADAKSDVVAEILARAQSATPAPPRGCFVVVSGRDQGRTAILARDLAARLELPLLSCTTVAQALSAMAHLPPVGTVDAVGLLLAIAADSGGAVLELPAGARQAADLTALGGRVVEVELGDEGTDELTADRLARRIRQAAASP